MNMIGFNKKSDTIDQTGGTSFAESAQKSNFGFGFRTEGSSSSKFDLGSNKKTRGKTPFDMGLSNDLPEGETRPLHEVAKIGDYVNYTVEAWTKEQIDKLIQLGLYGTLPDKPDAFEGFKVGDNKNNSIKEYEGILNSGWRVFAISEINEGEVVVTIIHAGISEKFLLSISPDSLNNGIELRDWSEYVNPLYATYANALSKQDMQMCIYLQNTMIAKRETEIPELRLYDVLRSDISNIGVPYWLCERFADSQEIYTLDENGKISTRKTEDSATLGIRVGIALKPNIQISGKEENGTWKLIPQ